MGGTRNRRSSLGWLYPSAEGTSQRGLLSTLSLLSSLQEVDDDNITAASPRPWSIPSSYPHFAISFLLNCKSVWLFSEWNLILSFSSLFSQFLCVKKLKSRLQSQFVRATYASQICLDRPVLFWPLYAFLYLKEQLPSLKNQGISYKKQNFPASLEKLDFW